MCLPAHPADGSGQTARIRSKDGHKKGEHENENQVPGEGKLRGKTGRRGAKEAEKEPEQYIQA